LERGASRRTLAVGPVLRPSRHGAGGRRPSCTVAAYIVLLGLVHEAGAWPVAFYGGFVLEHRYGLSTERPAQWARERGKALLVGAVLGIAGGVALYAAIAAWPAWWWLAAGAGLTLVVLLLAHLGPVLLLPLFYGVTPLDRPDLRDRLQALARRAGVPVTGVFRWALGDRTRKANAALAGLGGTRRILLSDTLLDHYTDDEIEVILAHELAHQVHHDIWRGIAYEGLLAFLGFGLASWLLGRLAGAAGLHGPSDVAGLPLLLLTAGTISLVLMPVANALSRRQERRADGFALAATRNPRAFVSAMRRLAAQNLAEREPGKLVEWLFYSHPPVATRIAMGEQDEG
jgi:STE24 endopeptidase